MSNEIDEELFGQIYSDTLGTLVNKLINTRNKEWNQIIVKNVLFINANKKIKKIHEQEKTAPCDWVIQTSYRRIDLVKTIKLILDFNKSELKGLVWKYKNQKWVSNFNCKKHSKVMRLRKKNFFFWCMYKMVLDIAKETWGKCAV